MTAPARTLAERVHAQLSPASIGQLDEEALVELAAAVWGDVELGRRLAGSRQFVWERLLHHARRGYLTPRERQGLERTLALGFRSHLRP